MITSMYRGWKQYLSVPALRPDFHGMAPVVQISPAIPINGNGRETGSVESAPVAPICKVSLHEAIAASHRHPRYQGIVFLGSRAYPQYGPCTTKFPGCGPVMVREFSL